MGGGGNKTSTTDSGVQDWARPYLENAAQDATGLYGTGALDNVAGTNTDQQTAYSGIAANTTDANTTFNEAQRGQGVFGADAYGRVAGQLQPQIDDQVTRALGAQEGAFAQTGNLGGARAEAAAAGAAGQIASDMSSAEVQAQRNSAMGGANAGLNAYSNLAASGQAKQDQIQAQQDAQYQGIQRLFGLINPGTVGSVQNTTSTGGK